MPRTGTNISKILGGYIDREAGTATNAAKLLEVPYSSLKNWLSPEHPCPPDKLAKLLPKLGGTLQIAERKYAPQNGVYVYDDFSKYSEEVFLSHFASARQVKETRIGIVTYPPYALRYRSGLNRAVYDRLKIGTDLQVKKVEQISNLDRAVDLAHNLKTFTPSAYEVRIFRHQKRIPFLNFSLFDKASGIAGGFHKEGIPSDSFFDFVGTDYVTVFSDWWNYLWDEAEILSTSNDPQGKLFDCVRDIPAHRELSKDDFFEKVEERGQCITKYATRY